MTPAGRPARPPSPEPVTSFADVPIRQAVELPRAPVLRDEPIVAPIPTLRPVQVAAVPSPVVRRSDWPRTLLPSCLILATTLPLAAAGWFAVDRFSFVRDNALGLLLPLALLALGLLAAIASALFYGREHARRSADQPDAAV